MFSHTDDMTDVYLINRKSEIEVMEILNSFTTESSVSAMYENEGLGNSISNTIQKIVKAILDSIASVFDMLSELFSKDKISKDEYLRSRQGEMVFDYDIVKRQKYINSKAKEGNNLMKRLLGGENVHDKVVNFVNSTARFLETKDGRNKIYATAAPLVYGYQIELKDTMQELNSLNKSTLYKVTTEEGFNKEDLKALMRTGQSLTAKSNNLVAMYFKQYDKLDKKDMKAYKSMRVK